MKSRSQRRDLVVVRALAAVALVLCSLTVAAPAHAVDYPTWDEVEAAKGNAAAVAAEVSKISAALDELQNTAAALADEALARAGEYESARAAAEAAQVKADALQVQVDATAERVAAARLRAGVTASQLSRSSNPALDLWLSGSDAGSTLYKLGTLSRLGDISSAAMDEAERAERQLASLTEQAATAQTIREQLAADAQSSLDAARTAQAAADAKVAEAQTQSDTLYAQLATLNNTTAELESEYRAGQEAAAAYAAAQEAARKAAAANSSSGSGAPATTPVTTVSGGSGSLSPADSRAYASDVVASRGWGTDQYNCLVSLWNRESGWRWNAYNASSGAYGIPQSLPGSKMATSGSDWQTSSATQIDWGLSYITSRYGTPCGAWGHSQSVGWY